MLFEDKEVNLIEDFRLAIKSDIGHVCLFTDSKSVYPILVSLVDDKKWKTEWVDTSAKNAPPPDFVNDQEKIMLEVMRIDDHAFERDGKSINPTNQKARKTEKEMKALINNGILHVQKDAQLLVTCNSDLPSVEDHNYGYYTANFKRIIEKHKNKIALYRKNHPGYTLVFFVFDESSMYCKMNKPDMIVKKGEFFFGTPHGWFYDKAFLDVIKNTGIDYFIWFTPYKRIDLIDCPIELPIACVFDCNHITNKHIVYDPIYMMSVED